MWPAAVVKPPHSVRMKASRALPRSVVGHEAVEGALGEGAFASRSRCRRAFPGERAHEIHEELRQVLIMDGAVDGQGADARRGIGRIVAPAGEDRSHGVEQQVVDAHAAIEAGTEIGEIAREGMHEAGIELEIAGVFRRGAVDDARPVRGDEPVEGFVLGLARRSCAWVRSNRKGSRSSRPSPWPRNAASGSKLEMKLSRPDMSSSACLS